MTREDWAKVTELFGDALDLETDARAAFLARLQESDPAAAVEVESLLAHANRQGEFLPDFPAPTRPIGDLTGRAVGSYKLVRLLGSGGMGTVYLAERSDGAFSKEVAVKLLSPAFGHARERFHRERELLARLEHPNIARLLDGGTTGEGWPYLVMEFVDGVPIDRHCRDHRLSVADGVRLLLQVCDGVTHAHQRLAIHCDIKPENILVTAAGVAKLLDFGIAKLLDVAGDQAPFRVVTPAFSSPEQLQGGDLTTATDVYAIGVLGYVVLTGRGPYDTPFPHVGPPFDPAAAAAPTPASRVGGLSPTRARALRGDLDSVLVRAVASDPLQRYQSVQQLADELVSWQRGFPVRARPDTVAYRMQRFVGRHRVACATALATVTLLVAAAAFSAWQAQVAARRFDELREFARVIVFDLDEAMRVMPGTTAARKLVADTALRYLDRLRQDAATDTPLREELAAAYLRVGKIQGGAFLPNLGNTRGAVDSFEKAIATVGPSPANPALERLRIEAHINIALLATDPVRSLPEFDRAIAAAARELALVTDDVATLRLMAQAYHGQATIAHVTGQAAEHERTVTRAIELREQILTLVPANWQDRTDLAREYAQHALAALQQEQPERALEKLARARQAIDAAHALAPTNQVVIRGLAESRSRTASVLTLLGRFDEANSEIEAALRLLTPLVDADADNRQYKADLAYAWLQMGDLRRAERRLAEALSWHERALVIRRQRAEADSTFMFVPWEFARSLNTVGMLHLELSPDTPDRARRLFQEAHDVATAALDVAPSFNEVRKQLALSLEGIGRAALAREGTHSATARAALEASITTWRDVFARSQGDRRESGRLTAIEALAATLP